MSARHRVEVANLVAGLERDWDLMGARIARSLRPGISDAEMDAVTLGLGIRLPEELRGWWGKHDGTSTGDEGSRFTFNFAEWLSVAEAAQATEICRDVHVAMADEYEQLGLPSFKPSFFVVLRLLGRFIVCDCADPVLAPVYCLWPEEPWRLAQPVLPRFAELLYWWREGLDDGAYELQNGSLVLVGPLPDERLESGLM